MNRSARQKPGLSSPDGTAGDYFWRSGAWLPLLCFLLALAMPSAAGADETEVVALVVGNNAPPTGEAFEGLGKLRFADDDAVRFYQFLSRFADRVALLAVLDEDTQRRYPGMADRAHPPDGAGLRRAVGELAGRIEAARAEGRETVFYLAWSGHGAVGDDGDAFLSLLDERVTRELLQREVIAKLPADYVHLVIDACHAGALVGERGLFDKQRDGAAAPVSAAEAFDWVQAGAAERLPGLGVLAATSADQETHEWSRFEAGVFSHEVLSGLSGPADVNGDGRVEYSEIHAFVAAANREIRDPRAVPRIIARPPRRNLHVPLVELDRMRGVTMLRGDPSRLGKFHVELENGQRYLDAHLQLARAAVALPAGVRAFVCTASGEAEIGPGGGRVPIGALRFTPEKRTARGALDATYRAALFASPFGVTYYKGFVDSIGEAGVRFDPGIPRVRKQADRGGTSKTMAITSWVLAGGALLASAVTGGLAIDAWQDFKSTDLQKPAHEANQRYQRYGTAALVTGLVAAGAAVCGFLLWPDEPDEPGGLEVGVSPAGVALGFSW